jgi:signal transduction histidine kinase
MNRVFLPAALAVLVLLGSAAGVWLALVHGVAAAMAAQAQLAGESLDARLPFTPALAQTLLQPGLHVVLIDRMNGTAIDASASAIATRSIPAGGPPPPPPPGAPDTGAPPAGAPPPGQGPRAQPGPYTGFARAFVRLRPIHTERDGRVIDIAPDLPVLVRWFALDVALLLLGILVIAGLATARVIARARRDREALEARIGERAAAVERYQRFLAETGHELRTPLTVMMGYVDILRAGNGAGAVDQRILDGMHAETTRMRGLVEKMMTLARLDSQAAVPRLLDIGTAAREAALTVQRRYPERDIRAVTDASASIIIDADDFAAAVGNLLENAVRYAPDSPIVIETRVRDGRAVAAVIDRGPGIGAEEREAIFDRFYRGGGRALGEGLGLGLAIVRRVAERWHGTIDVTSGDGKTEFRLSFPVADEESDGSSA